MRWSIGLLLVLFIVLLLILYLRGAFCKKVRYRIEQVPSVEEPHFPLALMGVSASFITKGYPTGFWFDIDLAKKNGVDVRILTVGPHNDKKLIYYAVRERYLGLLNAGIEIYEYHPSMMHAKVLLIDNTFVSTGSTNFAPRSFFHNDELYLSLAEAKLAQFVEHFFFSAFAKSRRIDSLTIQIVQNPCNNGELICNSQAILMAVKSCFRSAVLYRPGSMNLVIKFLNFYGLGYPF